MTHGTRVLSPDDRKMLDSLGARYRQELTDCLPSRTSSVSLLDFPRHQNAGDSLIWAGEWTALTDLGVTVDYIADIGRYSANELRSHARSGVILMHGGGNFGDLWPLFQDERDRVVYENPDRRIICLPQSIRFRDPARAKITNAIFARHGGVTVFARDRRSLDHAKEFLPDVDVRYCIDGALANRSFRTSALPDHDVLVLQRRDQESAGTIEGLDNYTKLTCDWGLRGAPRLKWAARRVPLAAQKRVSGGLQHALYPIVQHQYARFVHLNLRDARAKLARGRVVVTDRLHAHVLATLMGIPSVVVDNNYGKIRPIFDEYTGGFSSTRFATTHREVERSVSELLATSESEPARG